MKTTLDIPEPLLAEAMRSAGAPTKRAAVLLALEEFNRRARLRALAKRLGDSETFMGYGELMRLRTRGMPARKGGTRA